MKPRPVQAGCPCGYLISVQPEATGERWVVAGDCAAVNNVRMRIAATARPTRRMRRSSRTASTRWIMVCPSLGEGVIRGIYFEETREIIKRIHRIASEIAQGIISRRFRALG